MEHVLKGAIASFHMIGKTPPIMSVHFIKKEFALTAAAVDMSMLKPLIHNLQLHLPPITINI
jgi:hypothetical protein